MPALGQKDIGECLRYVRFAPKSGHPSAASRCLLSAKTGSEQVQQQSAAERPPPLLAGWQFLTIAERTEADPPPEKMSALVRCS